MVTGLLANLLCGQIIKCPCLGMKKRTFFDIFLSPAAGTIAAPDGRPHGYGWDQILAYILG